MGVPLRNGEYLGKKTLTHEIMVYPDKNTIEQPAVNYAADRNNGAGFGYPSFTATLIEKGFNQGVKWLSDYLDRLLSGHCK